MDDDEAYLRVARAEAVARVDRMVAALREGSDDAARWDEVYRHAHTLTGIARDLDPALGEMARHVAQRLRDPYGARVPVPPEVEAELRAQVERICERLGGDETAQP